jgi:hypothetical protein
LRQLAQKLAGPVRDDGDPLAGFIAVGDFDVTRQDNHQAGADLADGGECRTGCERAALAEAAHALDLQCIEHRQHLLAALVYDRWLRCHDDPPPAMSGAADI